MQVKIDGIDAIQRRLGTKVKPALRTITKGIAAEVQGEIAPYPPAGRANRPAGPGSKWYQRGYGPKWMRVDGSLGGMKTSQDMRHQWSISGWGRIGAVVRNIATYSPYVHEHKRRAWFHRRRGWVSDEEAVKKVLQSGVVDRIVRAALLRHLGARR